MGHERCFDRGLNARFCFLGATTYKKDGLVLLRKGQQFFILLKIRENYLGYGVYDTLRGSVAVAIRSHACAQHAGMNLSVRDFAEPVLGSRIRIRKFEWVGYGFPSSKARAFGTR